MAEPVPHSPAPSPVDAPSHNAPDLAGWADWLGGAALLTLGTLAAELAVGESLRSVWISIGWTVAWIVPTLALAVWRRQSVPSPGRSGGDPRRGRPILAGIAFAMLVLPIALEGIGSGIGAISGMPLEIRLLQGLRNLGVVLFILGLRRSAMRLVALIGVFLVLCGSSLWASRAMTVVNFGFVGVALVWLVGSYWSRFQFRSVSKPGSLRRRLPLTSAIASLAILAVAIATLFTFGPARTILQLVGVIPSSGGQTWTDPDARSGVGDGPNQVDAIENPQSFGFSQTDIYLDSEQSSLYDAFNDMYGEPYKVKKTERAIAIDNKNVREQEQRAAQNLQANREFSTARRPPSPRRPLDDRSTNALLFVEGPTPVHICMTAYDRFDGETWREAEPTITNFPLRQQGKSPWFQIVMPDLPFFAESVQHTFKIARLDVEQVPAPPLVRRFRVGNVDRPSFFTWSQDRILAIKGRTIPSTTVVETEAPTIHPKRVSECSLTTKIPYASKVYRSADGHISEPVRALARSWVEAVGPDATDWDRIGAIVEGVRSRCRLDHQAVVPESCPNVVEHFLIETRRGPDYLFATATALLLREFEIPTRLVGGLYADPSRFDPLTGHTEVLDRDAHLWVEVMLPNSLWIPVEPTPGYRLMPPKLPWWERLSNTLALVASWLGGHWLGISLMLAVGSALLIARRRVLDRLDEGLWTLRQGWLRPDQMVLSTLALLERRARRAGLPRPRGEPIGRWYRTLGGNERGHSDQSPDDLHEMIRIAERLLYSEPSTGSHHDDLEGQRSVCQNVVHTWSLSRFRACVPTSEPPSNASGQSITQPNTRMPGRLAGALP